MPRLLSETCLTLHLRWILQQWVESNGFTVESRPDYPRSIDRRVTWIWLRDH
jgi:hypothetical protein